jgi:hypothetical protein
LEPLQYLIDINEELIYSNYSNVFQNSSFTKFPEYLSQEFRDLFMFMKFRSLNERFQSKNAVNAVVTSVPSGALPGNAVGAVTMDK